LEIPLPLITLYENTIRHYGSIVLLKTVLHINVF